MHFTTVRHLRDRNFYTALQFATKLHAGQEYDGFPFIYHPLAVADLAFAVGLTDPVAQITLILHDTLEDTPLDANGLREFVVHEIKMQDSDKEAIIQGVKDLTDDVKLEKHEQKAAQLEKLPKLSYKTQVLKMADRAVNIGVGGLSLREISRFYWSHSVEAYRIFDTTMYDLRVDSMHSSDEYYQAGKKMLVILRDRLREIDTLLSHKEEKRKANDPKFVPPDGVEELRERLVIIS